MNEFIVSLNDKKKTIEIIDDRHLKINGKIFSNEFYPLSNNAYILKLNNKFYEVSVKKNEKNHYNILINNSIFDAVVRNKLEEEAAKIIEQKHKRLQKLEIKAPMPGMVISIKKSSGEETQSGETVIILEAMKMENEIRSPIAGVIKNIFVDEGTAVEKGTLLFSIDQPPHLK